MALEKRKEIIEKLEKAINARILTLVTGDRMGMETRIAPDILPLVSEHISHIGSQDELALFIYTPGGDTIAGWGLVNLLRQYCKKLKVLVPFRSLSCGTLISLGADEIVMGKHGLLSPIDPSVASPFNPTAPAPAGQLSLLPVSVEDMIGFLDLARKEIGLKDEASLVQLLKTLSDKVHPLALGAVYRAREQSGTLAKRLLSIHTQDETKVNKIVDQLTRELPTHNYLIGRSEAQEIGLKIIEPDNKIETLMWSLYKEYEDWLKITSPASTELDLGEEDKKNVRYERAAVESMDNSVLLQHIFVTDKFVFKTMAPHPSSDKPVQQILERLLYQGWVIQRDGG
jgi:hypothetical protein